VSHLKLVKTDIPPFEASEKPYRFAVLDVDRDWDWIHSELPLGLIDDTTGIIVVDRHGFYAAACIMDSWTNTGLCVHMIIKQPMVLRHGFLQRIADMAFVYAGKKVMIGMVPANNKKALKLDKHIGFKEIYRIRDGYDEGIDYVILELRREDCRWITEVVSNG